MKAKGMRATKAICTSILLGVLCASGADDFAFTYRGRINPEGVTIPETVDVAFSLYAEPTGGTAAWTKAFTVRPSTNGFFQCQLSGDGLAAALTNANARYIGVAIGGATERYLRQEVLPTPTADAAETAGGFVSGGTADAIEASRVEASSFCSHAATVAGTLDLSGAGTSTELSNVGFSAPGILSLRESRLFVLRQGAPVEYMFSSVSTTNSMFTSDHGGLVTLMSAHSRDWESGAPCVTWAVGPGDVFPPFSLNHDVRVYFYSFGASN